MQQQLPAGRFTAELVTPEKLLFSEQAEMVVVPGSEGDFGVLPGHAPVISMVRPGVVELHLEGGVRRDVFVVGGFAEVLGDRCTILAEEALALDELTVEKAKSRLEKAQARLAGAQTETDRTQIEREIAIADAMLFFAR